MSNGFEPGFRQCGRPRQDRLPVLVGGVTEEWGIDHCQTLQLIPDVPQPEHFPGGLEPVKPGYWAIRSVEPVRARAVAVSSLTPACMYHWGRMDIDAGGYAQPTFCSSRLVSAPSVTRNHRCVVETQSEDDTLRRGYWYFGGAYESPRWTEAHFSSIKPLCGEGVI